MTSFLNGTPSYDGTLSAQETAVLGFSFSGGDLAIDTTITGGSLLINAIELRQSTHSVALNEGGNDLTVSSLPAGSYYLQFGASLGTAGTYRIDLTEPVAAPEPASLMLAAAVAVSLVALRSRAAR